MSTPFVLIMCLPLFSIISPPTEGDDRALNIRHADGPLDCNGGLINGAIYTAFEL